MKTVVLDGYTLNPGDLSWEGLGAFGTFEVHDRTPVDRILERAQGADILLTNKTPLRREMLAALPSVRYVGVLATGYDIVDFAAAKELGIVVTNIPTYGTKAVAQFVFALLLELCHHAGAHADAVARGEWSQNPDFCFWRYPLTELDGKTMGIIGFGRIGRTTAQIAQAFGMRVLVHDSQPIRNSADAGVEVVPLERLYAEADVVSLHCPLFPETRGMICSESLARMKQGVFLINTSRGPLVVEEDLAAALRSGKVAGAAVDVVSSEPIRIDNPLLSAPNCLITPHIAWAPKESRARLLGIAIGNLSAFLDGTPVNVVNP